MTALMKAGGGLGKGGTLTFGGGDLYNMVRLFLQPLSTSSLFFSILALRQEFKEVTPPPPVLQH